MIKESYHRNNQRSNKTETSIVKLLENLPVYNFAVRYLLIKTFKKKFNLVRVNENRNCLIKRINTIDRIWTKSSAIS